MRIQQTDKFFTLKGINFQKCHDDFADDVELFDIDEEKLSDLILR